MRSARASVGRCVMRESLESGGERREEGENGVSGPRVAVERRKVVSTAAMDFVR